MNNSVIKSVLIGIVSAVVSVLVLSAVLALIAINTSDPTGYAQTFGIAILIFSCLVCGLGAARKSEGGALGIPICSVAVYLALCFCTTVVIGMSEKGLLYYLFLYIGAFCAGIIGALIGRRKKPKKPKNLKKYLKNKKGL